MAYEPSSTRRRLTYINSLMSDIWRHYGIWAVVHTSPSYIHKLSNVWHTTSLWHMSRRPHVAVLHPNVWHMTSLWHIVWRHNDVIFVTITYMTSSWHNFASCMQVPTCWFWACHATCLRSHAAWIQSTFDSLGPGRTQPSTYPSVPIDRIRIL
jgi:hypothetical protein